MLVNIGGRLFALVPAQSLEAGPEFFNSYSAPHNCVGGSEQGCVPGKPEASFLYKDPSKMNRPVRQLFCQWKMIADIYVFCCVCSLFSAFNRLCTMQTGTPAPSSWYRSEPAAFL